MRKTILTFLMISLVLGPAVGCSARRPKPKRAQSVAMSHFKSYGKKFQTSIFAYSAVNSITINGISEVSYRVVNVDAILHFKDGKMGRAFLRLENDFPKGWQVTSWELVGLSGQQGM